MPPRLCRLSLEHVEALLALDSLCLGGYWQQHAYIEELSRPARTQPDCASSLCFGHLSNSDIPATLQSFICAWLIGDEAHIINLMVHPVRRRQGLGRALVQVVIDQAQGLGLQWATLEVRASNTIAIRLYQSLGFQELGRRPRYYEDPCEDGLIFWHRFKPIPATSTPPPSA